MLARVLVASLFLAAGCGGPSPSVSSGASSSPSSSLEPVVPGPTRICDSPQDVEPAVTCTEAIGRVLLALGPDRDRVRAVWLRFGAPCPPNARCIAPPPGSAYAVIRAEGGGIAVVRLTLRPGEMTIGAPEDPTYDIWPRTGEGAPAVAAPDLGADVPPEIRDRAPLPFCGAAREDLENRELRGCFFAAVRDGRPAELVSQSTDAAGDPLLEVYRYGGRGPVVVYRNDGAAGQGWTRNDCAIGSAFDDSAIFLVDECLTSALP